MIVRTVQGPRRKIVYQRICEVKDNVQLRFVKIRQYQSPPALSLKKCLRFLLLDVRVSFLYSHAFAFLFSPRGPQSPAPSLRGASHKTEIVSRVHACGAQISARPKSRAQCRVLAPRKTSGHRVKCAHNCRSAAGGAKRQLQSKEPVVTLRAHRSWAKKGRCRDARCELEPIHIATNV